MKLIRDGKHIKTVPKKFEPILAQFEPFSNGKRLSGEERIFLSILLTHYKLELAFAGDRTI
jgi:hypothetical protein